MQIAKFKSGTWAGFKTEAAKNIHKHFKRIRLDRTFLLITEELPDECKDREDGKALAAYAFNNEGKLINNIVINSEDIQQIKRPEFGRQFQVKEVPYMDFEGTLSMATGFIDHNNNTYHNGIEFRNIDQDLKIFQCAANALKERSKK